MNWITRLVPLLALSLLSTHRAAEASALDDYVAAPDSSYAYTVVSTQLFNGYKVYTIRLTSQTWRTGADVAETLWQHWLVMIVPTTGRKSETALLIIGGGDIDDEAPYVDPILGGYASRSNSVIAYLGQVPNQPLHFTDETMGRTEDEIISYSFDKAMDTGDDTWPVLLPMVKSAVRAMDTVQKHLGSDVPRADRVKINNFVVTGASKRGWTTWLTTAVDKRVKSSIPMVIDVLNMDLQLDHHYRAYGFYSSAIEDYVAFDIPCRMWTPEGQHLLSIVDPYSYLERYTVPMSLVNATGDQFFLPDGSHFYFHDLPGLKHLRYEPNVDHGMGGGLGVAGAALEYFEATVKGQAFPEFDWTFEPDGAIEATTVTSPSQVLLWQANNPAARDFRLETIGEAWVSSEAEDLGGGIYRGEVLAPLTGWTAYFLELTFPGAEVGKSFVFTTDVRVIPDVLPYASEQCD